MAYLPPVVVEITGNTDGLVAAVAKAKAALDALKNSGGDIKIGAEVSAGSIAKAALETDRLAAATTRATNGGNRFTRWLGVAHMLLTAFGANLIADAIGIVAFSVGAIAAFAPVVETIRNLGAGYGDLNNYQKAATISLTNFIHSFDKIANPGIYAVVTGGLALIGSNLNHTGGIMDQATQAFENFVAMLRQDFASAPWQALFSRSSNLIQQDLTAFFHLISSIIGVIPALFHDFNGLGLFFINSAAGILHWIAIIGNTSPALARFAAGVFFVERALRAMGQFSQGSLLMRGFNAALTGSSKTALEFGKVIESIKTYGIGTTAFLLTGLRPAAILAAGSIALIPLAAYAFVEAANALPSPIQNIINSLAQQDHAVGANIAGYEKLDAQLNAYVNHAKQLPSSMAPRSLIDVATAAYQTSQKIQTLRSNLGYLEQTYHLTQAQAIQLAQKTGVNLSQAFAKGGGAAQLARLKIQSYEQTVRAAQNPTTAIGYDLGLAANKALALDDRVTALTNAFNALLTPFANVIADTVKWKDGNVQLESAVDKAHGKVNDLGNSVQRYAANQLSNAITNTVNLSEATLQQTGSMSKAIGPVQNEIRVLQSLGSHSKIVAQAIRELQAYINQLHSKTISITTNFIQQGAAPGGASSTGGVGHPVGYASGTGSATRGWHMVGEKGPELMYFRGGERVVPHATSMAVSGYASGTGGGLGTIENVIVLDGNVLYKSIKDITAYKNFQNNVRTPHGSAQGRMGTR